MKESALDMCVLMRGSGYSCSSNDRVNVCKCLVSSLSSSISLLNLSACAYIMLVFVCNGWCDL